jgi:proteic killer suppression protein
MAIRSFASGETEAFWGRRRVLRFQAFARATMRKLQILHAATSLNDLAAVSGNRLEKLAGDRAGQHSIRINGQWRVCFEWKHPDAHAVEINNHYG